MSTIDEIARRRRTLKLLPDPSAPLPAGRVGRAEVEALLASAGWAPFHRPPHPARSGTDGVLEPWRFHALDSETCRALIPRLDELPQPAGKIANMLAAADAMLLVTWVPEPSGTGVWEASDFNMEHIAASAAAVQTLLLAATEAGHVSYWSSGGVLATREAFVLLGIPEAEVLLGAVFLFPEPPEGIESATGKLRSRRSPAERWSRWVDLDR